MNRIIRYGWLAGVVAGLWSAALAAADRAAPARPVPAAVPPAKAPPGPAWLTPGVQYHRTSYPQVPAAAVRAPAVRGVVPDDPDPRPLAFVVNGAGDLRGCSNALAQANMLAGNPVETELFNWSHGHRRLLLDQIDTGHAREQGGRLAAKIADRRAREPRRRVVLVAHSAGCAVALAAGDALPPGTLDRVVLLAPSVSTGYDVRPTLRAAREGVDVFCSKKDWVALGFVTRVVGTADKFWAPAAGRHGFQPDALPDADADRLRQHFWSADLAWTGHTGGHHGMLTPAFLHAYVFPLIGAPAPV